MFEIGDKIVPLEAESDGCRSYYKVVEKDGEFIDVVNLNMLGHSVPRRCHVSDFVTLAEWDEMIRKKKAEAEGSVASDLNSPVIGSGQGPR